MVEQQDCKNSTFNLYVQTHVVYNVVKIYAKNGTRKNKNERGKITRTDENITKKEENTGKSGITQIEQNRFRAKIEIYCVYEQKQEKKKIVQIEK